MEAKPAVREVNREFSEAYNRGAASVVAEFYADGGASLSPDELAVRGPRVVDDSFRDGIKAIGRSMKFKTVRLIC